MVTLKDVAIKAKVSPSTVSRVISGKGRVGEKCRKHVQKVINEMKYRPNTNARALASRRTEMIGLITPNITVAFNGPMALGVESAAKKVNYKILIANSFNDLSAELAAIESFREQGCENIILHSNRSDATSLIALAEEVPGLVIINRFIPEIAHRCVWLDNISGGKKATEYALANGHKDFAVISQNRPIPHPKERIKGIKQALAAVNLTLPDENIFYSDGPENKGRELTKALVESGNKFTVLLAYNDLMAIEALNQLQDMGYRVPEDVSVIGFDDLYIGEVTRPQLTTMRYPVQEMAKYAAELSISLTNDKTKSLTTTHLFLPTLITRQSVCKR